MSDRHILRCQAEKTTIRSGSGGQYHIKQAKKLPPPLAGDGKTSHNRMVIISKESEPC